MPLSHVQKITNLQEKIDSLPEGATLPLRAQEFAGPIVIKRPLQLHGEGAILRTAKGPVVIIQSPGVALRDLSIEVTNEPGGENECAILTTTNEEVKFTNVEVCGSVIGLPGEEGLWRYPLSYSLGRLTQNNSRNFQISLTVPVACRVTSDRQASFEVGPQTLTPEDKAINLYLARFKPGEYVNGNIYLSTPSFRRCIMVHGYIVSPSPKLPPPAVLKSGGCRVFLSYARPDQKKVRELYKKLEKAGLEPWMDVESLPGGVNWEYAIEEAMQNADFLLTCISNNSLDRRGFIQKEIKRALDIQDRVPNCDAYIIPVLLEKNCKIPYEVKKYNAVALPERGGFNKLMNSIGNWLAERAQKEEEEAKQAQERQKKQPGAKKKKNLNAVASVALVPAQIVIAGGEFSGSDSQSKVETSFSRRLPVYLLLDCSSATVGEPIEATRQGIRALLSDLRSDPQAIETAYLSVITFADTAQQVCPLTDLIMFQEPHLEANGGRALGAALTLLDQCLDHDVRWPTLTSKGDWLPLVFMMISGLSTDPWEDAADKIKQKKMGNIIACAAGPGADSSMLKRITETVVELSNLQPDVLKSFFKWVSGSLKPDSQTLKDSLPPPPPDIRSVP